MDGNSTSTTEFDAAIARLPATLPVKPELVKAVMLHESGGNPLAVGDHGHALGLMQVHPSACRDVNEDWMKLRQAISDKNRLLAAEISLRAGIKYLVRMLDTFDHDERIALMAYNQGPTVIGEALEYATEVQNGQHG